MLYKERTGDSNAPQRYVTAEGYPLGSGKSKSKDKYKKEKLSSDRIKRLEEIGFTWEILEEKFEKGFQETLLYKERTGDSNAPQRYVTAEGYRLGTWQRSLKDKYKKGELSSDRINQLEEIGFKWERLGEQFEKGFQETLLYKERTGNTNTPVKYKTSEGYPTWNVAKSSKEKL